MSYPVLFDGHDLSTLFTIEHHMERTLADWQPNLIDAPASVGALFGGTQPQPVTVTMELYTLADTREGRQEALRTLAGWLAVDTPRVLSLGDEGGRYRMAIPDGASKVEAYLNADSVEVSLVCPDPRLYGETSTQRMGGTTDVTNGGTAPSYPSFAISGASGGSDGYLTITDQTTGERLSVPVASGASASVSIDCAARVVTVDNVVTMLGTTSDWLCVGGGETHALALTGGSGTADVTLTEMWW